MKKRVFRFSILYWVAAFFFPLLALMMLSGIAGGFANNFSWINLIYSIIVGVLSVIVCVKLFEKERDVVRWMNVCLIIFLIPTVYRSVISVLNFYFTSDYLIYLGCGVVFLILINKFRYPSENFDEINEIGQTENES